MTARKCDKCKRPFESSDDVIVILQGTYSTVGKEHFDLGSMRFVSHVHCWDGIEDRIVEATDEARIRNYHIMQAIRKEREGMSEDGDKGTPIRNPVKCGSCEQPTRTPVMTCPKCFRRRTYEY